MDRVSADLAHGVGGQQPTTASYCMRGHDIAPVLTQAAEQAVLFEQSATKIRLLADGRSLMTKHSFGRLDATSGNPSSVVFDKCEPIAAAWHDARRQSTLWTAGGKPLRLDVDALDTVADRAGRLAAEGGGTLSFSLTGRRLDIDGLKLALMSATPTDDQVGASSAMKR